MEPKLQKGFRVEILSRLKIKGAEAVRRSYENTDVGCEAIISRSDCDGLDPNRFRDSSYEPKYELLIIKDNGNTRYLKWYEESTLQLICCNAKKGLEFIEIYSRTIGR